MARLPPSPAALGDRIDVVQSGKRAQRRVLDSFAAVLQAAVAATLAWFIAHRVLGHPQPFFAPIAAAIALSTSHIQRSRRIAQMVAGVLLGIGVAEVLTPLLGVSTAALGAIVLVTMVVALAVGVGFFGDGMMFPNQAAASAVLVVAVHRHGTGAERAIDVLVGGAVALVIGVGLFPANPVTMLADAESDVLHRLAVTLHEVCDLLSSDRQAPHDWALKAGHAIHRQLSALARARATARVNVRVAPRRFHLRPAVDAEVQRTARVDLLANAVLSLSRAATLRTDDRRAPPPELQEQIASLEHSLRALAEADRPWPPELVATLERRAQSAVGHASAREIDSDQIVAAIVRATARDLVSVIEVPPLTE